MNISELGEFGLIDRISRRISKGFPSGLSPGVIGIGDDCAVIPQSEGKSLLVTTDMLIEDVHFLRRAISPKDLGHKSLAVNLSDIAAMGGHPKSAFLSVGLPSNIEVEWADSFFEGFSILAEEFGVQLLGGDTTRAPKLVVINVTLLGEALPNHIKLRSSARPGDLVCVTGYLGDSGAGLKAIHENSDHDSDIRYLIDQHHHPVPHLRQGAWLAERDEVHAMMDVSDGINSDLKRIMERSECGASVDLDDIPISPQLHAASERLGWDPIGLGISAGEDYCLLVTVDPHEYERLEDGYRRKFGSSLFRIGKITDRPGKLNYLMSGEPFRPDVQDFEHFPTSHHDGGLNEC